MLYPQELFLLKLTAMVRHIPIKNVGYMRNISVPGFPVADDISHILSMSG